MNDGLNIMSNDLTISQKQTENRIFNIRGFQVMIDSYLVEMYGVSISRLNEQVIRNIERFPDDFMFRLIQDEWNNLISQNAASSEHEGQRKLPNVFTEQGTSHDRFLIIDQKELYHLGASLKDLGKIWFAFSKMDHLTQLILNQLRTQSR